MKCIAYARVSSREQEETGYSLEAQQKLIKDYAVNKHSMAIARTFSVSESASGKQTRKTFNELLDYSIKHHINIIVCEKIDRLTRNLKDAALIDEWVRGSEG